MNKDSLSSFVEYCAKHIKGDEKGEAQIFLDHLFTALGYKEGLKGAGANCEYRIRSEAKKSTSFADLVWKPRVLIEMKKRGEDLSFHLQQAFQYWAELVPDRPNYVILCNFDEFWIYDFNKNIYQSQQIVFLKELAVTGSVFSFLLPVPKPPVFIGAHHDVAVDSAKMVASLYRSICNRRTPKHTALRYTLQCIIAMFAEDIGLLPDKLFSSLVLDCVNKKESSIDLIGGLFHAMNEKGIRTAGRYKDVDYFNGGLFSIIEPIDLDERELDLLEFAARQNWLTVNPSIFGTIFEKALEEGGERHKLGAHYTHEVDIKKIVGPVIVQPWTEKIDAAETLEEHLALLTELSEFKVLDPACGSGNFLFIAFKEMKLLERNILHRIRTGFTKREDATALKSFLQQYKYVNTRQFYGYDIKPFAVELAKVTLMVAKELSWLDSREQHDSKFKPLPLDNLDANIVCCDALLNNDGTPRQWVQADAIIGNPPYQSKGKMQEEFGEEYMKHLRNAYEEVPGRADFCVYWFYKAHQTLKPNAYAGLVGTNTIRQNYSREGSLDYIVKHNGTIVNAVSTEPWSGEAAVHVSIVSWKNGREKGKKKLFVPAKKGELQFVEVDSINSSLSLQSDVTSAYVLNCNTKPKRIFQGQTNGHEGFLLSVAEANKLLKANKKYSEVIKPFLIGDELVSNFNSQPERFVIDFSKFDQLSASTYKAPFEILKRKVLVDIEEKAELEKAGKIKANGREAWLKMWWKLWRRREDLLDELSNMKRYVSCARISARQIFEFVDSNINPSDQIMCFIFDDDYSFGIIQSCFHWEWWVAKCSTLGNTYRYTADSVWDTFPFPQKPSEKQIAKVAAAAKALREARTAAMQAHHYSLRDLYRVLEQPGKNPIKDLQNKLDEAVAEAYGALRNADLGFRIENTNDILSFLLQLNKEVHEKEEKGEAVTSPGLPDYVKDKSKYVSKDCVRWEG